MLSAAEPRTTSANHFKEPIWCHFVLYYESRKPNRHKQGVSITCTAPMAIEACGRPYNYALGKTNAFNLTQPIGSSFSINYHAQLGFWWRGKMPKADGWGWLFAFKCIAVLPFGESEGSAAFLPFNSKLEIRNYPKNCNLFVTFFQNSLTQAFQN